MPGGFKQLEIWNDLERKKALVLQNLRLSQFNFVLRWKWLEIMTYDLIYKMINIEENMYVFMYVLFIYFQVVMYW